jgi:hypothetical protein
VLLNLSKAYSTQRDDKQSLAFLAQAAALDPQSAKALGFVPDAQGGARAAALSSDAAAPVFAEQEPHQPVGELASLMILARPGWDRRPPA